MGVPNCLFFTLPVNMLSGAKDDPSTCCAAGESSGSGTPGIHIYCTSNGQDWKQTFFMASEKGHSYTLMGLEFTSATEAWGCGGTIGLFTKPLFLHTTDGGATVRIATRRSRRSPAPLIARSLAQSLAPNFKPCSARRRPSVHPTVHRLAHSLTHSLTHSLARASAGSLARASLRSPPPPHSGRMSRATPTSPVPSASGLT